MAGPAEAYFRLALPEPMAADPEFTPVFRALRAVLAEYEPRLTVVHDTPTHYYLDTHTLGRNKKPIMFGAVRMTKSYVSYHFMPVYVRDGLLVRMSPSLKKRMQGKACFNLRTVDPALIDELAAITRRGYEAWKKLRWVD